MPSLSFASWNVEHVEGDEARVADCVEFIRESDPDVFALYELKGEDVFFELVERMPEHHFFITEYPGDMNILVGCRDGTTAFVTQRDGDPERHAHAAARGAGDGHGRRRARLISVLAPEELRHTAVVGIARRKLDRVRDLEGALDDRVGEGERSNFIVAGDLNTMGMDVTHYDPDVSAEEELERYEAMLGHADMQYLSKTAGAIWYDVDGEYEPSDLDHAFASEYLEFETFGDGAELDVRGWTDESDEDAREEWCRRYSDHAMLYGEVVG